ncbi:hypothetical protein SKAU_G00409020 [Synaphobranchus kaupii]|uniref:MHC class I-like antigen recognition-like domain-containing protein n=1 Tax=Synaphobranchus kaupii TaxID=118154 RepID=A0A9Q1IB49_SYNKA|nr:hypothetical protein SKAU_G00409020 [Synaphobranchus kaupii]
MVLDGELKLEALSAIVGYPVKSSKWFQKAIRKELFVNEEDFFDPLYDYDFTHITDGAAAFNRGGERYSRPCGWNRIALKVLGKYKDGDGWLGMGASAWPVSYHGTSIEASHSLKYFYTGVTAGTDFPEFTIVGLVDDERFMYYGSNTRRAIPKTDWIKEKEGADYWDRESQTAIGQQQSFKANIGIAMQRFNQTQGE